MDSWAQIGAKLDFPLRALEILEKYECNANETRRRIAMDILKSNFKPKQQVQADEPPPDKTAEYEKRALESVCGSMVFVERTKLLWDKPK